MLNRSRLRTAIWALAATATLTLTANWAAAKLVDPMGELAGRWAGQGTVKPTGGATENFKCVVTYIPDGSSRLKQNLRCKSDSYRLDAATHLEFDGNRITGKWQDNIYSLTGTVNGVLTDNGFEIVLSGQFFTAQMTVAGSRCEQSVRVTPVRADYIREVSASLKKC
jgi:hypothetical protein